MASASPDNIKEWKFPKGEFIQNLSGHNSIVNSLAANADNVLVSGGMCFFVSILFLLSLSYF
jgi:pleiotropic regulator 1